MATKLELLKMNIGYRKTPKTCSGCVHFEKKTIIVHEYQDGAKITEDKNLRCGLYNFATKKSAVCISHETKTN